MTAPLHTNWSLRWIEDHRVRHTHLALAIPGGAAAEQRWSARAGISHLLEHVLYRQNDADGSPMDGFGGKFGLRTTRDLTTAYVAVPHAAAPEAASLLRRWWDGLRVEPGMLEEEIAVVGDEVRGHSSSGGFLLRAHVLRQLAAATHLDRDFSGRPGELQCVTAEELLAYYRAVHANPAVLVAVGPECPWHDPAAGAAAWRPEVAFARGVQRILLQSRSAGRAAILGLAAVPGLASPDVLQGPAGFAALEYGQLHPAQRAFHRRLRLRYMNPTLELSATFGLLGIIAYCPQSDVDEVLAIVEHLLRAPAEGSTPARLKRAATFHLTRLLEDPRELAIGTAQHVAYGCDLPATLARRASETDEGEYARLAARMEHAPMVIGALVSAPSPS